MKTHLLLLSFLVALGVSAQTVTFQPKWKVGDKRTAVITDIEYDYKNDVLVDSSFEVLPVKYEVTKETATSFTVKITIQNVALKSAANFYEKLGEELKNHQDLELIYQVNKMGGTAELLNWKEAKAFMDESFAQIDKLLKKKVPDMAEFSSMALKPILKMFDSKEGIEAMMEGEIKMLMLPFQHTYTLGDTLKETETEANPFNPAMDLSVTHSYYLQEKDKAKGHYTLDYSMQFDMAPFVEMMKSMMAEMSKSFGVEDSSIAKKNAELDDINFDMTNNTQWLIDSKTSWPLTMVFTSRIIGTGQGENRLKTQERKVVFQ